VKIDLYTRCWNDAHMLGFMFRHYDDLVQRYIVYDDGSTDGSLDILAAHPKVEIRDQSGYLNPSSRVLSALSLLETCWYESRRRADWVIVCDIDEHLYHPQIDRYLSACKRAGITIIPALGYQMIAEEFPRQDIRLSDSVTMGAPWEDMSKLNIFSPRDIEATVFQPGRHKAAPIGRIIAPERDELLLLHYKYMGFKRTLQRHQQYRTRQLLTDISNDWAYQYRWSPEQLAKSWLQFEDKLVDISRPDLNPWRSHKEARWWSDYPRRPCLWEG
jgi:glycosyltransferase involved in cell wall biosynthesis